MTCVATATSHVPHIIFGLTYSRAGQRVVSRSTMAYVVSSLGNRWMFGRGKAELKLNVTNTHRSLLTMNMLCYHDFMITCCLFPPFERQRATTACVTQCYRSAVLRWDLEHTPPQLLKMSSMDGSSMTQCLGCLSGCALCMMS